MRIIVFSTTTILLFALCVMAQTHRDATKVREATTNSATQPVTKNKNVTDFIMQKERKDILHAVADDPAPSGCNYTGCSGCGDQNGNHGCTSHERYCSWTCTNGTSGNGCKKFDACN
jgi:hypothetical protein